MATNEENETGPVSWVLDEHDLAWLREALLNASEIVVDLETTGLDEHAVEGGTANGGVGARISLAAFTLPQAERDAFGLRRWNGETPTTYILPCSHPDSPWVGKWRKVLRDLLEPTVKAKIPYVNQNIKFDARWLYSRAVGVRVDISSLIAWDTKDGAHLLDENESTKLKVAVPRLFNVPAWNDFALDYPGASEQVPLLDLGAYAARDTWWTWKWEQRQRSEMFLDTDEEPFDREERQNAKLGKFATWFAMPTVASLTKVEQRGMRLDVEWVERTLKNDEQTAKESLDDLAEYAHLDRKNASIAPTAHWFRDLTQYGVERDDLRITDLTPAGIPSWSAKVLKRQARQGSVLATKILTARASSKRAEFLRIWLNTVSADGRIHANFNSGSVVTGRLSSSNPNLQQVTKSLRPAFIPSEGFVIADFDYSQIEMRIAAEVSGCEPMIAAFQSGADLHRLMGATIVNERRRAEAQGGPWTPITPEEVSALERQQAKAANFGLLYRMGPTGFKEYAETAYGVLLSMEEAVAIHRAFFRMWDGMTEWHDRVIHEAHRDGFVTSPLGRVRRLPGIWDGNDRLVSGAERQAINSPVQSMASDLLQLAMASMQGLLPPEVGLPAIDGAFPVATVHDSIVVELPVDRWEETAEAIAERMQTLDQVLERFGVSMRVPLLADYAVGSRWSLSDVSDPSTDINALEALLEVPSALDEIDELELV